MRTTPAIRHDAGKAEDQKYGDANNCPDENISFDRLVAKKHLRRGLAEGLGDGMAVEHAKKNNGDDTKGHAGF